MFQLIVQDLYWNSVSAHVLDECNNASEFTFELKRIFNAVLQIILNTWKLWGRAYPQPLRKK